jgi:hypothetical protein
MHIDMPFRVSCCTAVFGVHTRETASVPSLVLGMPRELLANVLPCQLGTNWEVGT